MWSEPAGSEFAPDRELLGFLHDRLVSPSWIEPPESDSEPEPGVAEDPASGARLVGAGGAYTWIAAPPDALPAEGVLAGVKLAVKDLIAVSGRPLGAGSQAREDARPERRDARVVDLARNAGAQIVGTTTLDELAFGVTGVNGWLGTPANPHDRRRLPGGSSSGSTVAVAEGSATVAFGTDTGGSIRIPAALCGVVGFKPRYGSYPTDGVFPLAPTFDHIGTLARTVAGVGRLHDVVLPDDDLHEPALPARVGVARDWQRDCSPEVVAATDSALGRLAAAGCRIVEVEVPDPELVFAASAAILDAEAAATHEALVADRADRLTTRVRARLTSGAGISAATYIRARRVRGLVTRAFGALIHEVDVLAGPTVPIVAPLAQEAENPGLPRRLVSRTRLANLTGAPAISLPVRASGLPVGLELVAATNAEVLAAGAAVEATLEG